MEGSLPDAAIMVLTNLPDGKSARALARSLVETRLAACVSVGAAIDSMYHWQGQIETATEYPVSIKTRAALYSKVEAEIRRIHPYELPEVVAVPVIDGYERYVDWIRAETTNG
jgi:periplasmic divalent cation tolerance protein